MGVFKSSNEALQGWIEDSKTAIELSFFQFQSVHLIGQILGLWIGFTQTSLQYVLHDRKTKIMFY